jgi:rRNA-processing protein FCF1
MLYMKILMDADCLIKLTKAGLKEDLSSLCRIIIPQAVYAEVVVAGKKKGCDDAPVVEDNVSDGKIHLLKIVSSANKGDNALVELFDRSSHTAVGTDDAKLAKRLQTNGIPFILPAVIILKLFELEQLSYDKALWMLDQLSAFISADEYAMVKALIRRMP